MKRTMAVILIALFTCLTSNLLANDWELRKNVRRLEGVSPDYKNDKEIDKKFLEVLDLTEKTKKPNEIYGEAKKIAAISAFEQSKYLDSFLYYMMVKSNTAPKTEAAEFEYWLDLLKRFDNSPHLLAAQLIQLRQLPKSSPDSSRTVQSLVSWIKKQKNEMKVRPPEYVGNVILGYKPRTDFANGDPLKLYTLSYYKQTVTPPAGFFEEDIYISLLDRIKEGREEILSEMADIYRKMGKRKETADVLFQLALIKINAKEFQQANSFLDAAIKSNPQHTEAIKERDRIKLELTYQSLSTEKNTVEEKKPNEAKNETSLSIPDHLKLIEDFLTPSDRVFTANELQGKSKIELHIMRNEIFARHGHTFQSPELTDYFNKKPWYHSNTAYSDSLLTEIDKDNIKIIQEYEDKAE